MQHRMLIESDPYETRVAVLEDERLVEVFVERHRSRAAVGNIYKGRVTRVLAGMQAAFVDIGWSATPSSTSATPNRRCRVPKRGTPTARMASQPRSRSRTWCRKARSYSSRQSRIRCRGKGRASPRRSLCRRAFWCSCRGSPHWRVSRRIDDADERQRLLEAVGGLDEGHGLIVRTAGEGRRVEEFVEDYRYLVELWNEIEERSRAESSPSLLHADLEPALRVVRDLIDESYRDVTVQGGETFREVATFLDRVQPALADRVREFPDDEPLFESFGIEQQIDAALRSKVWLKSGGYLVINPTEALVAIDVNTGRFVGGANLEETVFKTNLEAVRELVRQIRLRDLGGIIVVDFIDMELAENRQALLEALQSEFAKDRSRSRVLSLSDFGLVEITRKRARANLRGVLTEPCPDCRGQGRVKSVSTVCLAIRREVIRDSARLAGRDPVLVVHPAIEEALGSSEQDILADIERTLGKKVALRVDPSLHREQFEVLTV